VTAQLPPAQTDGQSGGQSDGLVEDASQPAVPDALLPAATVVVCSTFDRGESLRRCVEIVLALDYPVFDVVVVDNRPAQAAEHAPARDWLRAHPRVRLVDQPRRGLSAARNAGAAVATGEILAFVDDDVEV
jgi:glycosyltransferase involved in cell wall biosynthesis